MNFKAIFIRSKNILFNPVEEWIKIDQEKSGTTNAIFGYALPYILAISISSLTILLFTGIRWYSLSFVIINTISNIITPFSVIIFSSIIINAISTKFESVKNINNAFKLVIYSYTAAFLTSIAAGLIPIALFSSLIGIAGIYSCYTLWTGICPMMKTPDHKKISFTIVSFVIIMGTYGITFLTLNLISVAFTLTNATFRF
ncbi:MAG: YIP1 family protein [Bacteroidia bacterium]|nr:YIP1 family protein [Bacteroidia bacterium]